MPRLNKPNMGRGIQVQLWRVALGTWIAGMRRARELTQEELGAAVGISSGMVSHLECGKASVPSDHYQRLAEVLGVSTKTFCRVVLRLQDPALYAGLYGADEQLKAELSRAKRVPPVRKSSCKSEQIDLASTQDKL